MKPNFPWQSWSSPHQPILKIPIRDYCPLPDSIPQINNQPKIKQKTPITGWCSWYAFGPDISEQIILDQGKKPQKKSLIISLLTMAGASGEIGCTQII